MCHSVRLNPLCESPSLGTSLCLLIHRYVVSLVVFGIFTNFMSYCHEDDQRLLDYLKHIMSVTQMSAKILSVLIQLGKGVGQ
jgi:hypothetical protein